MEKNNVKQRPQVWVKGTDRTGDSISEQQANWAKTSNKRSDLKKFESCEFQPIPLTKDQGSKKVMILLPPVVLHNNLLGAASHCLELLGKKYPVEMFSEFTGLGAGQPAG